MIRFIMKAMVTLLVLCVLGSVALSSCKSAVTGSGTTGTTVRASTTGTGPTGVDPTAALNSLVVASPDPSIPKYNRDLYKHWSDLDGNQCDAREDVLRAESETPAQVDPIGCKVVTGDWTSPYDGFKTTNPGELDVDHLVPLGNAHQSGAWAWTPAQREQYANDIDHPEALIAVSAKSNRAKGDKSPDQWKPAIQSYWCQYATDWVSVKSRWKLTITNPEKQALSSMLATCAK